ncbi:MAG: molybdopterin cofactor-binding domain-containing protein [Pseudomonadota bacterium]
MTLPAALLQNPQLSDWLCAEEDRLVVRTGKVELGQGISTAIAMIAAEELDVPVTALTVQTGSTLRGPNEFITAGSMSIESSGAAVRQACAEARHHLLARAADRFGVNVDRLRVEEGIIRVPGTNLAVSYVELLLASPLTQTATGEFPPKAVTDYRLVGTSVTRVDLGAKFSGGAAFIQDLRVPGMLHARIIHPPADSYRLNKVETGPALEMPGVRHVIVDGSVIGIVADTEYAAVQAKAKLAGLVQWQVDPTRALPGQVYDYLRANPGTSLPLDAGTPIEAPVPDKLRGMGEVHTAIYCKPYHLHGSIGPSAAFAHLEAGRLLIRSHTQGPSILQGALATALNRAPDTIEVEHCENAGCYGHNGADDAAMDAALLACHLPGIPILLKWQREDEHALEPFSPAMVMEMQASLHQGRVTAWNADVYSQTHSGRPIPGRSVSNLLAAWQKSTPMRRALARPGMGNHSGIHRNADPIYTFAARRVVKHLVPDQRVRTSSTRGLGAFGNLFAIESFMDELARAADADPIDFRLAHLDDPRAAELLVQIRAMAATWQATADAPWKVGTGFAFARYKNRQTWAAVAIRLAVNEETFAIRLLQAGIAADAGQVIDRDGLANQLEGGLIQSASWTLKEAVTFDEFAPASLSWESYPILRFSEVPPVDIKILDRPGLPSLGAGEATQGPTPAAIANAIHAAVGLRIREIPFTPDRLRSVALES